MKKLILLFLILFFPLTAFWWYCLFPDYKIIEYNSENYALKFNWFYDIFLSFPIIKSENIIIKDSHIDDEAFWSCKYEWFEDLEKLSFFDLNFWDKLLLIWNFSLTIFIISWAVARLIRRNKKLKILKQQKLEKNKHKKS